MKNRPYQPSNGTEGMSFEEDFCMQCIHTNPDPCKKPQCGIWCAAVCWDIGDKHYPKEWIYDDNDQPTCTAWVKWDWDNDGDPNDRRNPKAPVPDDPMQLVMPFEINEMEFNKPKEKQLTCDI